MFHVMTRRGLPKTRASVAFALGSSHDGIPSRGFAAPDGMSASATAGTPRAGDSRIFMDRTIHRLGSRAIRAKAGSALRWVAAFRPFETLERADYALSYDLVDEDDRARRKSRAQSCRRYDR